MSEFRVVFLPLSDSKDHSAQSHYRGQFTAYAVLCPLPGKYLPVQARQLLAGCIAQNKDAGLSHDETPASLFLSG